MAMYLLFEEVAINYRPVLIDGNLEASYPSSTTMLALCVLPTAMMQLKSRIRHIAVRRAVLVTLGALTAFRAAALRCALADRYYRRCVTECWACYVICVRNKKARKVER